MSISSPPHSLIAGWDLDDFNQRVKACQDEVYTLAMHLLGNENLAGAAIEEALRQVYLHPAWIEDFRLHLLRMAVRACIRRRVPLGPLSFRNHIVFLAKEEKLALILVDCIELTYADAAVVLQRSTREVQQVLARARYRLRRGLQGDKAHGK
jgi:DNA-directed RNA polymerase specialized sigma24 family protein